MAKITSLSYNRLGFIFEKLEEFGLTVEVLNALSTEPEFGREQVKIINENYRVFIGKGKKSRKSQRTERTGAADYFSLEDWQDLLPAEKFPKTVSLGKPVLAEPLQKFGAFSFYLPEKIGDRELTINLLLPFLDVGSAIVKDSEASAFLEREKFFSSPLKFHSKNATLFFTELDFLENFKLDIQLKSLKKLGLSLANFQLAIIGVLLFRQKNKRFPDARYQMRLSDIPVTKNHLTMELWEDKLIISSERNSATIKVSALPMLTE